MTLPEFTLNHHPQPWREGLTIAALLAGQGRAAEAVATALNGVFVARAQREAVLISPATS